MIGTDFFSPQWDSFIPIAFEERQPLTTKNKDGDYDLKNARHYLSRSIASQVNFVRACAAVNEGFASGRLWGLQPDVQSYLMDKGKRTGRQPMSFNMFTAMLARHLGMLSQVDIHARATSSGYGGESRRQQAVARAAAMAMAYNAGGPMVQQALGSIGVDGDEMGARIKAAENATDPIVEAINDLLDHLADTVDIDGLRKSLGQSLSLSGLAGVHCYFNGSRPVIEPLSHENIIWDPDARYYDFRDAEFVSITKLKTVPELMELYEGSAGTLERLQQVVRTGGVNDPRSQWREGKPRPFTTYYQDGDFVEMGYVNGPNGSELVTIGVIDPDTGKERWSKEDVIDPPENRWTRSWKGRTDRRYAARARYATFIPREYAPAVPDQSTGENKPGDILLASGYVEDMEILPSQYNGTPFPVMLGAWLNIRGYIVSPLTAAQGPQRTMQIIASDISHRISKATGRSVVLGARALAGGKMDVKQAAANIKEGDPIQVDEAVSGSVQNAIGIAGEGLDPNIDKEFGMLNALHNVNQNVTQLYDNQFGARGSANELVGVKRLQYQQLVIAQWPFNEALRSILQQVYNWMANAGRRNLLRHPSVLEDIVGQRGAAWMMATKDMETEQVKVDVVLAPDERTIKQSVDEMVLGQFLPAGLLGPVEAAELLGSSSPEQVYAKAKEYTRGVAQAQQMQLEQQQQQQAMSALDQEQMRLSEQEQRLYDQALTAATKSDATDMKGDMPLLHAQAKVMEQAAMTPEDVQVSQPAS